MGNTVCCSEQEHPQMQPTRKRIMSISSCTSCTQSEVAYRNYLEAAEKFREAKSPSPRSRYT